MITPFHPDGRVNEESAVALAHHLLANGSHGLVVAGTTGEAATLTDEEQVRLVALIAAEAGGEGAIVAGRGLQRHAPRDRADGGGRRGRRRGGPVRHALLQQAEPARHRAPLRGGRARGGRHAGRPLQHPRPHGGQHAARPARRAGPDRRDRGGQAGQRRRPAADRRPRRAGRQRRPARPAAWTSASPAASASPRTSSARRCGA